MTNSTKAETDGSDLPNGTMGHKDGFCFLLNSKYSPKKAWIYKGTITTAYQNIGESRHQRRFGSLEKLNQIEQVDVWSVNGDFEIAKKGKSSIAYGFEIIHNAIASEGTIDRLALRDTQDVGIVETLPGINRYPNNGSQYGSQALYVNMRYDLSPKTTWSAGGRITNTLLKAKWKDDEMLPTGLTEVNVKNTAITGSLSLPIGLLPVGESIYCSPVVSAHPTLMI